jgi:hypothetical protein
MRLDNDWNAVWADDYGNVPLDDTARQQSPLSFEQVTAFLSRSIQEQTDERVEEEKRRNKEIDQARKLAREQRNKMRWALVAMALLAVVVVGWIIYSDIVRRSQEESFQAVTQIGELQNKASDLEVRLSRAPSPEERQRLQDELASAQAQLAAAEQASTQTQGSEDRATAALRNTQQDLKTARDERGQAQRDLAQEQSRTKQLEGDLASAQQEITRLTPSPGTDEFASQNERIRELEAQLARETRPRHVSLTQNSLVALESFEADAGVALLIGAIEFLRRSGDLEVFVLVAPVALLPGSFQDDRNQAEALLGEIGGCQDGMSDDGYQVSCFTVNKGRVLDGAIELGTFAVGNEQFALIANGAGGLFSGPDVLSLSVYPESVVGSGLPSLDTGRQGSAQDFRNLFADGVLAFRGSRFREARGLFEEAIAANSVASSDRVRIRGQRLGLSYLPYFWLGKALDGAGDCEGAMSAWSQSEVQGVVLEVRRDELLELRAACAQGYDSGGALQSEEKLR